MEIHRDCMEDLLRWKESTGRKPLIIQGARQIGKTWIMQKFGQLYYDYVAYFNFDASQELCREFENTKSPSRLVGILGLYTDQPVLPGKTLLIFDEIQQSNKALNSLKYFCEEAPEYHVMAAGSLLGVSLSSGDSFPVGKVEFLQMYPLSFREFLRMENPKMYEFMEGLSSLDSLPEIVMGQVSESFRRYAVCGGMPAAVAALCEGQGLDAVEKIQRDILQSYSLDFSKHAPAVDIPRIAAVWSSIPSQLAKENRKFIYKMVKDGARAREYESALLWLQHAGLIYRVFCAEKPGLPLSAYKDMSAFKVYLNDVGLLRSLASLPAKVYTVENPLYAEFRGAMAENMVLQALVKAYGSEPCYWVSSGMAEVDFLLQREDEVYPIEVKSGLNVNGKSLGVYMKKYAPKLALRYSMRNLKMDGSLLNIPLFMVDWTDKLLRLM